MFRANSYHPPLTTAKYRGYVQTMLHTDRAMERVVGVLQYIKKAELARRAELPESTLRDLGRPDWKPNASTLQKLEQVAIEIEQENEDRGADSVARSAA